MTAHPSFYGYDRRDPIEVWNRQETIRSSSLVLMWVLIIAGLVLILHLTVEPRIGIKKAEAALVDDKVLCSNPLTESREVGEYCWDLFQRGL